MKKVLQVMVTNDKMETNKKQMREKNEVELGWRCGPWDSWKLSYRWSCFKCNPQMRVLTRPDLLGFLKNDGMEIAKKFF
jgi:hypothetical protein